MTHQPDRERTARVIAVDDDRDILTLMEYMLGGVDVSVQGFTDPREAVNAAKRELPDLLLLDYDLPGTDGLEVLSWIRTDSALEPTPVIFVTASDDHSVLTACFAAGAADYVRKPFCAAELRARVCSVLERSRMILKLERLAQIDSLTELPNRASIRRRVQAAISREPNEHYALLFLDLDRFKLINDTFGHELGDMLLKKVAHHLRASLRDIDSVAQGFDGPTTPARLGGDEFVVLLEDLASPNDALVVAQRILDVMSERFHVAGHDLSLGVSIGVVTSDHGYMSADEVLRDSDTAMYQAKATGKGRFVVFDPEMRRDSQLRLETENRLRRAIRNSEFALVYQPVCSLTDGGIRSVEALVRWNDPERGEILPAAFIPIAEETGLILPLGAWVLEEACRQIGEWAKHGGAVAGLAVHVNVSRRQLATATFVETVAAMIDRYGIEPGKLQLEVTESELMRDPVEARNTLMKLRELGVHVHMDDFGTEYSSLSCLQSLPIDTLKIDRSFVAAIGSESELNGLLHAVTTLAQNMGIGVIAEGIETPEQLAALRALECPYGQGYHFARPLPGDQIAATCESGIAREAA